MVAATIALAAMAMKARRSGTPLSSAAPALRFALAFVPPLVAGIVLTPVFAATGLIAQAARVLAAALRHGGRDRRRVLGARRAAHGPLLHGARRGRVRRAGGVGSLVDGRADSAACTSDSDSSIARRYGG